MIFSNHPATMSSRYWNSYYDRKVLETLSLATAATLLCEEPESDVSFLYNLIQIWTLLVEFTMGVDAAGITAWTSINSSCVMLFGCVGG